MKPGGVSTKKKSSKVKAKPRTDAERRVPGAVSVDPFGIARADDSEAAPKAPDSARVDSGPTSVPTSAVGVAAAPRDPGLEERRVGQVSTGALVLVVVAAVGAGITFGPATAVLVLASGAFVAVIALFWSSLRTLLGETPLSGADAYAIGAARAEEEQKRAVLRALKDLEFERSVGKTSEEDYRRLVAHYRGEAKRLLRILDEESQPMRDRAEALVNARLKASGLDTTSSAVFRQPGMKPGEREREAEAAEATRELRDAVEDNAVEDNDVEDNAVEDNAVEDNAADENRVGEDVAKVQADVEAKPGDDSSDPHHENDDGTDDKSEETGLASKEARRD